MSPDSLRRKAADLIIYAMSDVGGQMNTKRHAAGVDSRVRAAARAEELRRRADALEMPARASRSAHKTAPPETPLRQPTLAQVHRRDATPPERALLEREVWSATHRDYRGYSAARGHEVMADGALVALSSMADADLAALHTRRVGRG